MRALPERAVPDHRPRGPGHRRRDHVSCALALLAQEFHGRERGTAFGIWGATIASAAAVGPLLGGVLTEAFGWSSIFFINVPIGVAAVLLTIAKVAESRDPQGKRIDWIGTVTFTSSLFLFVLAIIRGNAEGWGSTLIVSLFAASLILMVVFIVSQFVQDAPMFDVTLFRKPTFGGASIVAFTLSAAMFAMFLYLVLYLQTILGLSPLQTGLRFLPFTVVSFFVAAISGNLSTKRPGPVPARRRAAARRGRAAADARADGRLGLDGAAARASSSRARASVSSTRPSPRPRSASCRRSAAAWPPGSTTPSGRSVSPPGSRSSGAIFESSISSHLAPKLAGTPAAGHAAQIGHAVAAGGAGQVVHSVPAGQRHFATVAIHSAFVCGDERDPHRRLRSSRSPEPCWR